MTRRYPTEDRMGGLADKALAGGGPWNKPTLMPRVTHAIRTAVAEAQQVNDEAAAAGIRAAYGAVINIIKQERRDAPVVGRVRDALHRVQILVEQARDKDGGSS